MADAAWTTEYTAGRAGTNPAAGTPPTQEQLTSLGFPGSSSAAFITRLHMRYTPEQADQDLTLYAQHMTGDDASAYADASPRNDCIEYNCDGTLNVDSGGTDTDLDSDEDTSSDSGDSTPVKPTGCGCGTTSKPLSGPTGLGLLVGLGALLRRRRRGAQKQ
jgi:MYXO-CTERM domain-containing protein